MVCGVENCTEIMETLKGRKGHIPDLGKCWISPVLLGSIG